MNSNRDYARDMQKYLEDRIPSGDVVLSEYVEKLVAQLEETDPDLLYGWLLMNAAPLLGEYIKGRWRHERQSQKRKKYAKALEEGDAETLRDGIFERERYVVDENNRWRSLGEMTGKDHEYVARGYEAQAKESALRAAFHRAIAKQVGNRKTAEVLTPEQYSTIWKSMSGR